MSTSSNRPVPDWTGSYRSYDLLKEIAAALVIIGVLVAGLAAGFGQPERAAVTFQEWATNDPAGFVATTLDELTGSSETAQYGPPYTHTADAAQSLLGVSPQQLAGESIPVDTSEDMVLRPLGKLATPDVASAIDVYRRAGDQQRSAWATAYRAAVDNGGAVDSETPGVGPLPTILDAMLAMARNGAVDAALVDDTGQPGFFVLDYTRSQLYLADGDYFASIGEENGLAGEQWGMVATLDNWPGQVWLMPVSFWYQFPPGSTSDNGDAIVLGIVTVLGVVFILVPWIPGLRDLPRRLGIYRLIWRDHYAATEAERRRVMTSAG